MNASLVNKENFLETLQRLFNRGVHRDFCFAAAYVSSGGVSMLERPMREFIDAGGSVRGIVDVSQGITTIQGITQLSSIIEKGLHLYVSANGRAKFHPKLYCFSAQPGTLAPSSAIVGSSNMSAGGFKNNEECNVWLDDIPADSDFSESIKKVWDGWRTTSIVCATADVLENLNNLGVLADEHRARQDSDRTPHRMDALIRQFRDASPQPEHSNFAMTLSHFDTSDDSGDPVILIPITARRQDEAFWYWPHAFMHEGNYPHLYLDAPVVVDGEERIEHVRIYAYRGRSEFRLKSELIKRNGNPGDVLWIERGPATMRLHLVRQAAADYMEIRNRCDQSVPGASTKMFGWF